MVKIAKSQNRWAKVAVLGLLIGLALSLLIAFSKGLLLSRTDSQTTDIVENKVITTGDVLRNLSFDQAEPIWEAYQARYLEAVAASAGDPLSDLFSPVLDQAFLTADGTKAVLWLALEDPNGQILHTEPGLVLANQNDGAWKIILPADPEWRANLNSLPPSVLPAAFQEPACNLDQNEPSAPITGYYLPWVAGTSRKLEGSVLHFHSFPALGYPSCSIEYCRYAYDFMDASHFPLVSARAGVVIASRDSCANGNTGCTNYIVIQDVVGGAYQVYLHLAQNTIPDRLKNGTYIGRGNYIGDTDDTGYSTSEHVHFMVVRDFWYAGDGYPWGRSLDIRFADVTINAGIPRTCYEVTRNGFCGIL